MKERALFVLVVLLIAGGALSAQSAEQYQTPGIPIPPWGTSMDGTIQMFGSLGPSLVKAAENVLVLQDNSVGTGSSPERMGLLVYIFENDRLNRVEYHMACSSDFMRQYKRWFDSQYVYIYGEGKVLPPGAEDGAWEEKKIWNNGLILFRSQSGGEPQHVLITFLSPGASQEEARRVAVFDGQSIADNLYGQAQVWMRKEFTILNDTPKTLQVYASQGIVKIMQEAVTIRPGAGYRLPNSTKSSVSIVALEEGTPGNGTKYYTGINGNGWYTDKRDGHQEFYTTPVEAEMLQGYDGPVFRLSKLPARDWLSEISFDLGYGEKVAVSYYRNGRWNHEVHTGDFTIRPQRPDITYVWWTGDKYVWANSIYSSPSSSVLGDILDGDRPARGNVAQDYEIKGGSRITLRWTGSSFLRTAVE